MDYILTLNKINRSDTNIAGFRGVDLAELHNKKIDVPVSFVIKSSLFEDFLEKNSFRPQINKILKDLDYSNEEALEEAYTQIKDLFLKVELSKEVQDELMESYETLAIDMDHIDIAKLVTAIDKPNLTVVGSPNYIDDSENNENVFQNIKGKNALIKAIVNCWISLYTPKALIYREENNITTEEKTAIIVQRMIDVEISAHAFTDEENIILKTFFGFQDYHEEFEKDTILFDKGTLTIKNSKVNFQEFQYVRDLKDGNLIKKPAKDIGEEQKLNDKDSEELARVAKKSEGFVQKPIKIFLGIRKAKIYVLFVNRIVVKKEIEEEAIKVPTPDSNQKTSREYEEEIEMNEASLNNDVAFLDEIETYEKKVEDDEKKSDWAADDSDRANPPIAEEKDSSWANDVEQTVAEDMRSSEATSTPKVEPLSVPSQEPSQAESIVEEATKEEVPVHTPNELDTESITEQSQDQITPEEESPVEEITTEEKPLDEPKQESSWAEDSSEEVNVETKTPEPEEPKETLSEEAEEVVSFEDIPTAAQNPEDEEEVKEKPIVEEPPQKEEEDDFIFSSYEDAHKEPIEKQEEEVVEAVPETKPETEESAEETSEEDSFGEAEDAIKKIITLSDKKIFDIINKKLKEVNGDEAATFEEAIEELKKVVRVPFESEIKKIHKMKKRADKGEELEIEEATLAYRTAKNFLSVFE